MKKYIKYYLGIVTIVIFLLVMGSMYYLDNSKNQKYLSEKKSILELHKGYLKDVKDIKVIDEFNYGNNKVVLFSYKELTGYAIFIKEQDSEFKIEFVQTVNKKNVRQTSKAIF